MKVEAVMKHELWSSSSPQFHDIAVVRVSGGEAINEYVQLHKSNDTSQLSPQTLMGYFFIILIGYFIHSTF